MHLRNPSLNWICLGRVLLDLKNNNKNSLPIWFTLGHLQTKTEKQVKFYYPYSFSKHLFSGHWKKKTKTQKPTSSEN